MVLLLLFHCSIPLRAGPNTLPDIPDQSSCKVDTYDERIAVNQVLDGDTIVLADNRHVRLIGINTPEIDHDEGKSELGAEQAQDYLSRLLRTQKIVRLHYDKERTDHYGRTLAHLFLDDGTNIQSLLLYRGLATTLTIPPNLDFVDCYRTNTEFARIREIGLWALKQYQPLPAESVSRQDLGYRIITGTVLRIGDSRSAIWINLAKHLALRITREDLLYFDNAELHNLTGKKISARGRLYFSNGEYRMQIRHPVDLVISDG